MRDRLWQLALGCGLSLLLIAPRALPAGDCTAGTCCSKECQAPAIRIGAVAYSPGAVTIFEGVRRYFDRNGLPVD